MSAKEKHARLKPLPPDIGSRLEALPSVLLRHPVRVAYLFGSAARTPTSASDIDLAVLPEDGFSYAVLYADLSTAPGTDRLDLADLRAASPLLQWEVVTTGRRLMAASDLQAASYEQAVRNRYRVERGLLAGLGLPFQIAEHVLSAHFHRAPETYEGLLTELRDCGVLAEPLYHQLRGSGGFRDVLVHEHVKVDLKEVEAALRRAPAVFRAFGEAVSAWLAGLPEDA